MSTASKWVGEEIGAMFSQVGDSISVPEAALSGLVESRNHLLARVKELERERDDLAEERDRYIADAEEFKRQAVFYAFGCHQRDTALVAAREALESLTKPLYKQGASQNEVINNIQRRDKQIHDALSQIQSVKLWNQNAS